jgi:hypothetical protein
MDITRTVLTHLSNLLRNIVSSLYAFPHTRHMHCSHAMLASLAHSLVHGSPKSPKHLRRTYRLQKPICCYIITKLEQLHSNQQLSNLPSEKQAYIPSIRMPFPYLPSSQPRTQLLKQRNRYQLSFHHFLHESPLEQHWQELR